MIITVEQIQNGIIRFIDNEIGAKAVGLNKFIVYFILPKLSQNVTNLITQYKDNVMFKDYFDENGNVKLDDVYNSAKTAIAKSGQFTAYGLIFTESDIDKLYEYIKSTN